MAWVRILVDGYSLLHAWRELLPGQPPYSPATRDELVRRLRTYGDAQAVPITLVFDGAATPSEPALERSCPACEIVFSRAGQTADDVIERLAHRLREYGEVLVVTDDHAERDTVMSAGGITMSCENFVRTLEAAEKELDARLRMRRSRERRAGPLNPIQVDRTRG